MQVLDDNVCMAGRRTNLALLVLLGGALGTGALSFALGNGWARWAVVAHGVLALGILLLAPWKSVIARRGLRRQRPGSSVSLAFSLLVAAALATGVGHSTGLLRTLPGGLTAMQVHVGCAVAAIPLGLWHVVARRVRPHTTDLSRRTMLRAGALAAGSVAAYGGLAGLIRVAAMPGRGRRFTGSFQTGSFRPEEMPVTQWLNDRVPAIDGTAWSLGLRSGGAERRLSLQELDSMREPVRATIDCTGGWFAEQDWEGVRLDLLFPVGAARSIRVVSATGYARRFPLTDAARLWVATRAAGETLSAGHGYPARLVAPGRRGFWWVKWISAIEVSGTPWWWQPPFPLT